LLIRKEEYNILDRRTKRQKNDRRAEGHENGGRFGKYHHVVAW
jgi:hypothetical protein